MIVFFLACEPTSKVFLEEDNPYPTMMVTADMREELLLRIDREPYAHIFERLQEEAEREIREPEMETWDHNAWGYNGELAQHNAMLAWLKQDDAAAEKALELLDMLDDDFELLFGFRL
mgnify:CR=1 FL=1